MQAAEERHWWYAGLHDLVVRRIRLEAVRVGKPLDILDSGCGTGQLCKLLQPFGSVTGCDIHPMAIEATAQRGVLNVHCKDVTCDDLGMDQYDVITSMDVLCHRAVMSEGSALRNLYHALRKGGLLLVQVPAFRLLRGRHDQAVHNQRRYRRKELVRLLDEAGFRTEAVTYRLLPCFLPAFLWRRLKRTPVRSENGRLPVSDLVQSVPGWLNQRLAAYVRCENRFLASGGSLCIGTSVFAAARK